MTDGDGPDGTNAFRELREYSRGRLDVDHHDILPIAGLIRDDRARSVIGRMAEMYDPSEEMLEAGMPRRFAETTFAKRAIRRFATDTATHAVETGNETMAAFISGLPSYKSDVSGLHAINQLADWLTTSEATKLIYMASLMGRGKTDFSLLCLEVVYDHYRRLGRHLEAEVPTPEFATNFWVETPAEVDGEVTLIDNYDDLLEWAARGDSSMVRWFVFDEASTELTAQSGDNAQKVAETFGPFTKKMRKNGINMIVIGHDRKDVHPAIRTLADYVDKSGKKTARFYAGVKDRGPVGHLFDIQGIPPTSWTFDTDDTAEWSWGSLGEAVEETGWSDEELKRELAKRAGAVWVKTKDLGVTQEMVAKAVSTPEISVSTSMVSTYAPDEPPEKSEAQTA